MKDWRMSSKKKKHRRIISDRTTHSATFHNSVLQSIRQHARGSLHMEICGVLIGRQSDAGTFVSGAVPGEGAAQGGAHVTFTQQAWVGIHEEKERKYPGQQIVGWYHSHPGFGVFLSDHDIFIHKNFFASPGSLAWVYDPHSDEEGCFGWNGGEVRRLENFSVVAGVSKEMNRRDKPAACSSSQHIALGHRFAFWRSPNTLRTLFLVIMAAIVAMIAGFGWIALRHTSTPQSVDDRPKRRHSRRHVVTNPAPIPISAIEPSTIKADPQGPAIDHSLPENSENNQRQDGGHDEQ